MELNLSIGCYYCSGRNNTINNVIKNLYDLRLTLKDDSNPSEDVIQLLMGSMHGKTIIQPVETDTIIKDSRDDFEKYIPLSYNYIGSALEVNGRYHTKG